MNASTGYHSVPKGFTSPGSPRRYAGTDVVRQCAFWNRTSLHAVPGGMVICVSATSCAVLLKIFKSPGKIRETSALVQTFTSKFEYLCWRRSRLCGQPFKEYMVTSAGGHCFGSGIVWQLYEPEPDCFRGPGISTHVFTAPVWG